MRLHLDTRYTVLGLIDGIILALGLGAKVLSASDVSGAFNAFINAGILAAVSNLATAYVTELHRERADLLLTERKMVISERGRLFHTALYRSAQLRTLRRAASYSVAAFAGAFVSLLPIRFVYHQPLLEILLPLLLLFALGFYLGRKTAGRSIIWGLAMVLAGVLVTVVGLLFPF